MSIQEKSPNVQHADEKPTAAEDNSKKPPTGITFSGAVRFLVHDSVMEHFLLMIMFSYCLRTTTTANLFIEKACLVELKLDASNCSNLHNNTEEENEVQTIANNYHIYQSVVTMGPSIVVTLIFGSWSDIYGRKIPILIASAGTLTDILGVILNYLEFGAPIYWMIITSIPSGLSGGLMVTMMGAISYIVDVSTSETRIIRFAFLQMTFIIGAPIGVAVGGIIFKTHGHLAVFLTSLAVQLFAFVYVLIRLKEPNKQKITKLDKAIKDLFSLDNIKNNISSCTKQREGTIRREIWMIFLAMFCFIMSAMGTTTIAYYYTMKMYGWDNYKFSLVSMVFSLLSGVVVMIAVPLFTKVFKLNDITIALIGVASQLAAMILRGLAFKESLYYISNFAGVLNGISSIGGRSRLSKLVAKSEAGKVFSVFSLTETLVPLAGTSIFGAIYSASVSSFPGLAFIIAAGIVVIPLLVYIFVFMFGNKLPDYEQMENEPVDDDGKQAIK